MLAMSFPRQVECAEGGVGLTAPPARD